MRKSNITFAVVALAAAILAVTPAFAAKGHGSSISLAVPAGAAAADLTIGSQATFDVSTTATSKPWVDARCYQNGALVYEQWAAFYPGSIDYKYGDIFTLGPTRMWSSGSADCTADLVSRDNYQNHVLASTSFQVSG
jgi:hypothetical protein